MSEETFAAPTSNEPGPALTAPSEADYDAICAAVMETVRGRWFLSEYSRRNRHSDTELVIAAIDRIESTLRGERTTQSNDRFRYDLMEMAKAIARTKGEITGAAPDGNGNLGAVTEELDYVVQATEQATTSILAAAAQIQEISWTMREQGNDARLCDQLDAHASDISTACATQELNTQRTEKVVHVMRYLEGRINAMIDVWGEEPFVVKGTALGPAAEAPRDPSEGPTDASESAALLTSDAPRGDYLNGNGHASDYANGHIVIEHDLHAPAATPVAPAGASEPSAVAAASPAPSDMDSVAGDPRGTINTADAPRASDDRAAARESAPPPPPASPDPDPAPAFDLLGPGTLSSYSDVMALVFPAEDDGEAVAVPPGSSLSAPLVVLQPTFESGPVVIAPENAWANTTAIAAMTAPALESVLVISDQDDEAATAAPTGGATSLPDLYALHVERSAGARTERADAIEADEASVTELRGRNRPAAVVIDFDLEPLATGAHGPIPVNSPGDPAAAPSNDPARTTEKPAVTATAAVAPVIDTKPANDTAAVARSAPEPMQAPAAIPARAPAAPVNAAPEPLPAQSPPPPPTNAQPHSAPVVFLARAEAKAIPAQASVVARPVPPAAVEAALPDTAAVEARGVTVAPEAPPAAVSNPEPAAVAVEQAQPPIAASEPPAPSAKPAAPAGNVKLLRPLPAPAPIDPLAAIAALSDEEKIALFS